MFVVDLKQHEFIRISGPDSIRFLQGQVSCNMELLSAEHSLNGALCNLQGRVIADFRLVQLGEDCLLQTGAGLAQKILDTLARYAVFSKVEFSREQVPLRAFGAVGEQPAAVSSLTGPCPEQLDAVQSNQDFSVIRVAGETPRYEIWCHSATGAEKLGEQAAYQQPLPLQQWLLEDIAAGIAHVQSDSSEEYMPQLLNYDISGVIDFKKGCYTGQEVVARMFYRGKVKKRLFRLSALQEPTAVGQAIVNSADATTVGEVLSWASSDEGASAQIQMLAILNSEAAAGEATLSLAGQPDSTLQLLTLPYSSPAQD
jgi:tRNA-modifying protein YgfZ